VRYCGSICTAVAWPALVVVVTVVCAKAPVEAISTADVSNSFFMSFSPHRSKRLGREPFKACNVPQAGA
jgi:hypothetical protein